MKIALYVFFATVVLASCTDTTTSNTDSTTSTPNYQVVESSDTVVTIDPNTGAEQIQIITTYDTLYIEAENK